MQVLKHSLVIDAPPNEVWRILTTPELVKEWAAAYVEGLSIRTTWRPGEEVAWKTPGGATLTPGRGAAIGFPRLAELRQSARIILQACDRMADDAAIRPPSE